MNMLKHPLNHGCWAPAKVETKFFQIANLFGNLGVIGSGGKITKTLYEGVARFGGDRCYGGRRCGSS
jgi:hypothetical protein